MDSSDQQDSKRKPASESSLTKYAAGFGIIILYTLIIVCLDNISFSLFSQKYAIAALVYPALYLCQFSIWCAGSVTTLTIIVPTLLIASFISSIVFYKKQQFGKALTAFVIFFIVLILPAAVQIYHNYQFMKSLQDMGNDFGRLKTPAQ